MDVIVNTGDIEVPVINAFYSGGEYRVTAGGGVIDTLKSVTACKFARASYYTDTKEWCVKYGNNDRRMRNEALKPQEHGGHPALAVIVEVDQPQRWSEAPCGAITTTEMSHRDMVAAAEKAGCPIPQECADHQAYRLAED